MCTNDDIFLILLVVYGPLLCSGISIAFFLSSPKSDKLSRRILASVHGLWINAVNLAIMLLWGNQFPSQGTGWLIFYLAMLVSLLLIACSFFLYRGPRLMHLLHLVNLGALFWTWLLGGMVLTGSYV